MDSSDVKNSQRNRPSLNESSVDDEVQKLFRKNNGKISSTDFIKLRRQYNDTDLVEKIQTVFLEKHSMITKKATKFAQLIRDKYSNRQYPLHILLQKARLFKVKYDLSEDEFAEFQRIYEHQLVGLKSSEVIIPSTNMMKILGSINVDFQGFDTKLNDNEYKVLQEILKLYASSRPLHAQILLQSMQYSDCGFEALTGEYKKEFGHKPGDSIHPVIAAMFLPKINVLDTHFLHSNISGIVNSRYNGEPLTTRPDYTLFDSLIKDPNDIVCDSRSPMADLLNRAQLQNQLWNCVLNLRNGQYYNSSFRDFINCIDMCRLNKQDTPDLIYGRYDGTILKRLLSSFSFRPTHVATNPVYQVINMNPYQQNVRPMVTSVPMINLRLPPESDSSTSVKLSDAVEQKQYFLENGIIVPRNTSLIYSRGVLFFYVDRRANVIRFNDMQPFNIGRLPTAISGFERLNDKVVEFEDQINVNGDNYKLRSVVLAEVNRNSIESNIVVGSSAIFMIHSDGQKYFQNEYFMYDPLGVSDAVMQNGTTLSNRAPISQLRGTPDLMNPNMSFIEMAQRRGIIFLYENAKDKSEYEVAY
jgi:hypothetical protein